MDLIICSDQPDGIGIQGKEQLGRSTHEDCHITRVSSILAIILRSSA